MLAQLKSASIDTKCKVQAPVAPGGRFSKDRFSIDLLAQTLACPAGITVPIRTVVGHDRHAGKAEFAAACTGCPLAAPCTTAKTGRSITTAALLAAARGRHTDPAWKADYRHPTQGRMEDRAPDAATPRRTPRPHARPTISGG